MPRHNVRPRVIKAIAELQTFTAGELCRRADLTDTDQAHNQIDRLRKEGYLEQEQLPPSGPYKPYTLYKLTSKPDKRGQFLNEFLTSYPSQAPRADERITHDLLRDAEGALDKVEAGIEEISGDLNAETCLDRLRDLRDKLESPRINIETALIEYGNDVSEDKTPNNPAVRMQVRWRRVSERLEELHEKLLRQNAGTLATAAAITIADIAPIREPAPERQIVVKQLKELLGKFDCAVAERFSNEVLGQSSINGLVSSLFRYACSATRNPKVAANISKALLKRLNLEWLKINGQNVCLLANSDVDWAQWVDSYPWRNKSRLPDQGSIISVYSFPFRQLTHEAYVKLAHGQSLSIIAPDKVTFLGPSEEIETILLISDQANRIQTYVCSYLNPSKALHAYGAIARDIIGVPGSPSVRVAECLRPWGSSRAIGNLMQQLQELPEKEQAMLVIQAPSDRTQLVRLVQEQLPDACPIPLG